MRFYAKKIQINERTPPPTSCFYTWWQITTHVASAQEDREWTRMHQLNLRCTDRTVQGKLSQYLWLNSVILLTHSNHPNIKLKSIGCRAQCATLKTDSMAQCAIHSYSSLIKWNSVADREMPKHVCVGMPRSAELDSGHGRVKTQLLLNCLVQELIQLSSLSPKINTILSATLMLSSTSAYGNTMWQVTLWR